MSMQEKPPILCDIVMDGNRCRLAITEQKAGKQRVFTVSLVIYQYIENYCFRNSIDRNALMFPLTIRAIQKQLALVCEYLGYEGISTHSFRKWYATEVYRNNGYDMPLCKDCYSIAVQASHSVILAVNRKGLKRRLKGTQS